MASGALSLEVDGLTETLKAFQGLEADLRREANGKLRAAARECATRLAALLVRAAGACGVPVAPRVARSIRVKTDRLPVVTIGGPSKVGAHGGTAGALVWGSEQGPKGDVNHFAVAPSSGYWIAPTVARFASDDAVSVYLRAVVDIERSYGLI